MIAATRPLQRPPEAKLLVAEPDGTLRHLPRAELPGVLRPGDLLVANDAATIPASLTGVHRRTGAPLEVRLAARGSLSADNLTFTAVLFGEGDYRTPTEFRPVPPPVWPGDSLDLGPLTAIVREVLDHLRLVRLELRGDPYTVWHGIARHGRPIQYAHVQEPLELWDVWTPVAARPVAFEPPSAGFLLDWALLRRLRERGIQFATVTHAAGISSTGDPRLDRRLPLPEAYHIPAITVRGIHRIRQAGGSVVALGTSTTRALEHAGSLGGGLRPGPGLATLRIGPQTELRVVDAIITGVHEPGTSHHELLGAFASDDLLRKLGSALETERYRSHEFGDSVMIRHRACSSPSGRSAA